MLWLIGGTQESAMLARDLVTQGICCVVTVTTAAARRLYPDTERCRVWVGKLTPETVGEFLQMYSVRAILDASHPFAAAVSELAIATAADLHLPYLRFERSPVEGVASGEWVFPNVEALLESHLLINERVLLTIGYRYLPLFQPWQDRATLFARILPSHQALAGAIAAGFTPDRLIALRPPISAALEKALWQQWQISLVVAKASGSPGGEDIKRQVAADLGIQLATIARPALAYPQVTSDWAIALDFCRRALAQ
ncbi:cobalt-precorrin-6A reductase [Leptolyngbya sp. O-77]|uniref:cobalt-precorrin-6A reductase n=1 Tax=Leptolyngbya sp. O-77 TaxID=1080068 RepID=UPI00074D38BC|nr:cobalt-precorrin-6A reductase [Leptolyngbya sp. O-77]BAU43923.1 cobalt-precorrin-6x reductase [Leptolyngbya sp. O-77]